MRYSALASFFTLVCVMQSYMRIIVIGFSTSLDGSVVYGACLASSRRRVPSPVGASVFSRIWSQLDVTTMDVTKMTSDVVMTSHKKQKTIKASCANKMHLSEPKNSLILRVVFFRTWAGFEPPLIAVDWSAILIFVRVTWRQSENPRQPPGNPRNGRQRRRSLSLCRRKIWWLPWYSN